MRIKIQTLAKNESILGGAPNGRRLFVALIQNLIPPAEPEAYFLDFAGVQLATSSFLRESVLAFRDFVRKQNPNVYPVIANAVEAIREELEILLDVRADALWACELTEEQQVRHPKLIGTLDPMQRATFDLVVAHPEVDAPTLAREHGRAHRVGTTAWNNRLAALAAKGLVVERSAGRSKIYRSLLEGR